MANTVLCIPVIVGDQSLKKESGALSNLLFHLTTSTGMISQWNSTTLGILLEVEITCREFCNNIILILIKYGAA